MTKKALILGITGQDGSLLAHHLLGKNYCVIGSSRDAHTCNKSNLDKLNIENDIEIISINPGDFQSVITGIIKTRPDEIYNLSGQTSVGLSFTQPVEANNSISLATLNLLEGIKLIDENIKLFNAGSSECFGNSDNFKPFTEESRLCPRSPYGVAKSTAYWLVNNYREAYNLYCVTGILANHESPLRPLRFVTRKIVEGAYQIAIGNQSKMTLGPLSISRDWGWAPEYVQAMHLMMQSDKPDDFIIATGKTYDLEYFTKLVFGYHSLNYLDYIETDNSLLRPIDIQQSCLSPQKIKDSLGWEAKVEIAEIVEKLVNSQLF